MTAVTTNTQAEEYNPFADQPPPPPEVSVLILSITVSACLVLGKAGTGFNWSCGLYIARVISEWISSLKS